MLKVLVIDDELLIAQMIVHTINWEQLDMQLIGLASDGEEGERMILSFSPDIVITDVRMPVIDGIQLIKNIRNNPSVHKQPHFIIISGYDDFEYAQSALRYNVSDYILKPYDEDYLTQILLKISSVITEKEKQHKNDTKVLEKLNDSLEKLQQNTLIGFFNRKRSFPTLEVLEQEISCSFTHDCFTIVLVKIFHSFGLCSSVSITDHVLKQLRSSDYWGPDIPSFSFSDRGNCCLLLNHEDRDQSFITITIHRILETLLNDPQLKWQYQLSLGYSSCNTFFELLDAYKNAQNAVNTFLISGTNRCYCCEDFLYTYLNTAELIKGTQKTSLIHAFECLDRNRFSSIIQEIFHELNLIEHAAPNSWFELYHYFVRLFLDCISKRTALDIEYLFQDLISYTDSCLTIDDFPAVLIKHLSALVQNITAEKEETLSCPITQAIEYIRQNYSKPIRLNDIAGYVYLTPQYFSELFKKECGQNFIDYLANYRIEIAKQYLLTPGEKIKDISLKVGYIDAKSFSQVFKKHVGLTPQEFRRLYL